MVTLPVMHFSKTMKKESGADMRPWMRASCKTSKNPAMVSQSQSNRKQIAKRILALMPP
jgi:hypothetical protein